MSEFLLTPDTVEYVEKHPEEYAKYSFAGETMVDRVTSKADEAVAQASLAESIKNWKNKKSRYSKDFGSPAILRDVVGLRLVKNLHEFALRKQSYYSDIRYADSTKFPLTSEHANSPRTVATSGDAVMLMVEILAMSGNLIGVRKGADKQNHEAVELMARLMVALGYCEYNWSQKDKGWIPEEATAHRAFASNLVSFFGMESFYPTNLGIMFDLVGAGSNVVVSLRNSDYMDNDSLTGSRLVLVTGYDSSREDGEVYIHDPKMELEQVLSFHHFLRALNPIADGIV